MHGVFRVGEMVARKQFDFIFLVHPKADNDARLRELSSAYRGRLSFPAAPPERRGVSLTGLGWRLGYRH